MKTNKERYINLLEIYMNDCRKDDLNFFYGDGSKIKVKNIEFITQGKYVFIEAIIILGDLITEEYMERSVADSILKDAGELFFGYDLSIRTMIGWDA